MFCEYQKRLDEFMRKEYEKTKPRPNQMVGKNGWYATKKKEFDEQYEAAANDKV